MSATNKQLNILKIIISLAILSILFYKIGLKEVMTTSLNIHPVFIILAIICIFLNALIGSLNLWILLNSLDLKRRLYDLFRYYILTWAISIYTPGRIGELSTIYFLKKENINLGTSSAVIVIDKMISLIVTSIFAIIGFLIFFNFKENIRLIPIVLSMIIIIILLPLNKTIRELIKKYILKKYSDRFKGFYKTMMFLIKNKKTILLMNFILTIIKWVVASLAIYFLFIGLDINVNFALIILITSIIAIISLIPISIGGLGVRETSAVILFQRIGIIPVKTLGVYTMSIIIRYLLSILITTLFLKKGDIKKIDLDSSDLTAPDTPRK